MENKDTGLLLDKANIELQRIYFKEMVTLLGINTIYKAPKKGMKDYNLHGNMETAYELGVPCGCIFEEHPTVKTMRKLGWDVELSDSSSVIHVPFDLQGLQKGGLFIIPDTFNSKQGRVFRVIDISSIVVYPASLSCELAPEYESTMERSETEDFTQTNFNLLNTDNH